jgi:small subunit ribosomal protein S20
MRIRITNESKGVDLAHSKSAQKRERVAEKRRLRNRSVRSRAKTNITKAERLIFSGELEVAREAVVAAISSLDKAAEKGIIHPNNAARRKSRLMKKLNQAQALSSAETESPEPEETAE